MATTKKTATKTAKAAPKKVASKSCAKKACASKTCARKCAKKEQKDEKHKFIIFGLVLTLALLGTSLGVMTWARYYTVTNGTASAQVAKWNANIANSNGTLLESGFELPMTYVNTHTNVKDNKIAPGSIATGTFKVDLTGTEVDTDITIDLSESENLPTNAVASVTINGMSLTCNANVCTGTLTWQQIDTTPVATVNVSIDWENTYGAGNDNDDDTADGEAAEASSVYINISARQHYQ